MDLRFWSSKYVYVICRESDLSNRGYLQLAQELSYQWLGAFTTPAWWSDAHLNKALVGYIAAEIAFKVNGYTFLLIFAVFIYFFI